MSSSPPFLTGVSVVAPRITSPSEHPFKLPFVPALNLTFTSAVTIFVGENGSGKSTLLEAIAALSRLPVSGGSRNELGAGHAPEDARTLASVLRPSFRRRPMDGYFLRAEFQAHFASLLEQRAADPDFRGDPHARYGGKPLHTQSHGEAFLSVILSRFKEGIFLLDEPEAALSPQRQLALLTRMHELVSSGNAQFIIATHSPILMTYPGAELISFDDAALPRVRVEETTHYEITKGMLESPGRYWKHLTEVEPERPSYAPETPAASRPTQPTQPTPNVDLGDVERIVKRDFRAEDADNILNLVAKATVREKPRVVVACLKISNGDAARFSQELFTADQFQDALLAEAEYPLANRRRSRISSMSEAELAVMYEDDWRQYSEWLNRGRPSKPPTPPPALVQREPVALSTATPLLTPNRASPGSRKSSGLQIKMNLFPQKRPRSLSLTSLLQLDRNLTPLEAVGVLVILALLGLVAVFLEPI